MAVFCRPTADIRPLFTSAQIACDEGGQGWRRSPIGNLILGAPDRDTFNDDTPDLFATDTLQDGGTIDLVLSDIVMPGGMNGIHLAQEMSERHPRIRVLLTTGYSDMAAAETRYPILRKPFEASGLERAVREAVDGGRRTEDAGGKAQAEKR